MMRAQPPLDLDLTTRGISGGVASLRPQKYVRISGGVLIRCSESCTFTGFQLEFKVEIMYFDIHQY